MKGLLLPRTGFILIALLTVGSIAPAMANPVTIHHSIILHRNTLEEDILQLVNQHRAKLGLAPLSNNAVLTTEAEKHSKNMASRKVPFGHKGFPDRMKTIMSQVANVQSAAENVAHGDMTAEEVVNAWLKSPEHKKNIEGNYRITGLGIQKDKKNGGYYFTQIFAG
ncbi:MAG: CAP domain-containing protein [Chitinophagaceae bacterium]